MQIRNFIAATFLATATAAAHAEAPVPVKTDGLADGIAMRVQQKAAEGSTALRRFVERTRMVYGLSFNDLVTSTADTVTVRDSRTMLAGAPAGKKS